MKRYVKLFEQIEQTQISIEDFYKFLKYVNLAWINDAADEWLDMSYMQETDNPLSRFSIWLSEYYSIEVYRKNPIMLDKETWQFRIEGPRVKIQWTPAPFGSWEIEDVWDEVTFLLRMSMHVRRKIMMKGQEYVERQIRDSQMLLDYLIWDFNHEHQGAPQGSSKFDHLEKFFFGNIDWIPEEVLLTMGTPQEVRRFRRKRAMSGMFGKDK
jgi:hypothetical protein